MLIYVGDVDARTQCRYVLDTYDGTIEIIGSHEIYDVLSLGIEILGFTLGKNVVHVVSNEFFHLRDRLLEISATQQLLYYSSKNAKLYVYSYGYCYTIYTDEFYICKYSKEQLVLHINTEICLFSKKGMIADYSVDYEKVVCSINDFKRMVAFD